MQLFRENIEIKLSEFHYRKAELFRYGIQENWINEGWTMILLKTSFEEFGSEIPYSEASLI